VLYHVDLAPRNIFIDVESGSVTGVLDWDRAESAPVEAAWQMPAWLWDNEASGSNQLRGVSPDDIPLDPQPAEIRRPFIEEIEDAIPRFVDTVRGSKPIFELLTFARRGLYSVEVIDDARSFLKRMDIEV
jgi:Phosphotransferase enzyme family